jgi:hypothetical protein
MTNKEIRLYRYDNCKATSKGKNAVLTDATNQIINFDNTPRRPLIQVLYKIPTEEMEKKLLTASTRIPSEDYQPEILHSGEFFRIGYRPSMTECYGDDAYSRVHAVKIVTPADLQKIQKTYDASIKNWEDQYENLASALIKKIDDAEKVLKTSEKELDKITTAHRELQPQLEDILKNIWAPFNQK